MIHRMTDREETKVIPCMVDDCTNSLLVSKFERNEQLCPECIGEPPPEYKPDQWAQVPEPLTALRCPFDDARLEIIAVDEKGGHIDLGCPDCRGVVSFSADWRCMMVNRIPPPWRPIAVRMAKEQIKFDPVGWR